MPDACVKSGVWLKNRDGRANLKLRVALAMVKDHRLMREQYAVSLEEWHEAGRRPHYCIHGVNLWTDNDIPCGPCEDGHGYWSWSYLSMVRECLDAAESLMLERDKRIALASPIMSGATYESDLFSALFNWVHAPIAGWLE
jgi:hypothetical protein